MNGYLPIIIPYRLTYPPFDVVNVVSITTLKGAPAAFLVI